MKNLKAKEIRKMWLDFFKSKGHNVEASSPLVPINDPTLLWINAGVAPLKKYFDGSEKPVNPRITNAQKCIRTNDIENVGKTARHHTFFEMLGNFSIGDYFKNEAIEFGYELLTSPNWFAFDKDKLYMTYYTEDKKTYEKWLSLGVDDSHLIPLDGNFWEIGEGPCGPDTEIFYDRGIKYDKDNIGIDLLKNDMENDRYIEIWNIVFSQYNSKANLKRSEYPELPNKNIDTGSGLERLACVMQEVDTNYDTDLFMPIINKISEMSNVKYEGQMAFKVIADHIRTVTFAISDGAVLSNEGRGYVLRRVLRRATKYGKKLGINKAFMYELVDTVIEIMDDYYPYLHEHKETVKMIVKKEEEKFLETLSSGEKKFEEIVKASKNNMISGDDAFMLYDTFGFPIELTLESALEVGYTVDLDGFKKAMEMQKQRARNAREDVQSMKSQNEEYINFMMKSRFVGYDTLECNSKVIKVFEDGIVLDETPFYATSGGQVFDKGTINGIEVLDVSKMPNGQFIHKLKSNDLAEGMTVKCVVSKEIRENTCKNHSSAHLFQKALHEIVGNHIHQQGSYVSNNIMRFDFNNYNALTDEEIIKIEDKVNEAIKASYAVNTDVMNITDAKKTGAEALFGEKYGELVRVVNMGGYSIELCGGTHVSNTSDIISFNIASIESIGSGIYRCSAVTGKNAKNLLNDSLLNIFNEIKLLDEKAYSLDNKFNKPVLDDSLTGYRYVLAVKKYLANYKEIVKELEKAYKAKLSKDAVSDLSIYDALIENNKIIAKIDIDSKMLKTLADALLNRIGNGIIFLASVNDDKITFVCKNNVGANAGMLVKEACMITNGSGGGKADIAQGGGKDISKLDDAINRIKELTK